MLLRLTDRGLYCEAGDFFVDPWGAVDRAVVTHAHGDHVAWGCRAYLTSSEGLGVLRSRLAPEAKVSGLPWGEPATIRGVRVSLHPAGHILGSAQVRLELGARCGSSPATTRPSPIPPARPSSRCAATRSSPSPPSACRSTAGPRSRTCSREINAWWRANQAAGKASLLFGYALGKAQRLIAGLDPGIGPILTHGAVERMTAVYRAAGVALPPTTHAGAVDRRTDWSRAIIVAPPSADGSAWTRRFGAQSTAFASGWMLVRGTRRRRSLDRGFALSDHVDWPGLWPRSRPPAPSGSGSPTASPRPWCAGSASGVSTRRRCRPASKASSDDDATGGDEAGATE